MNKKKLVIFIAGAVLIPVLAHLVVNRASIQGREISDEEILKISDQLLADSEILLAKYDVGSIVMDKSHWPESIKNLSPMTVSVVREGLQIKTQININKEWGILVTRSHVVQNMQTSGMPVYRKISKRIYRYYIDISV